MFQPLQMTGRLQPTTRYAVGVVVLTISSIQGNRTLTDSLWLLVKGYHAPDKKSSGKAVVVRRFGEKLRTLRERRQLSQTRLGLNLGYSDGSFISQVETGKKNPTAELVLKVADYFDVSTDDLLRDEREV